MATNFKKLRQWATDTGDVEAAKLLRATTEVAEACVDWVEDVGECHFCGFGLGPDGITRHEPAPHDPECPMVPLLLALGKPAPVKP